MSPYVNDDYFLFQQYEEKLGQELQEPDYYCIYLSKNCILKIACFIGIITVISDAILSLYTIFERKPVGPVMLIVALPEIYCYLACWRFLVNKFFKNLMGLVISFAILVVTTTIQDVL